MTIDLQAVIAIAIAYILYCGVLAGGIQLAINQLKPLFLTPIKDALTKADADTAENRYLIVIYVFRTVVTALAYVYLWGGVSATRAVLAGFASTVPDIGIAVVTVALVVLGEEVLHPVLERLYTVEKIAKELGEITVTVPTTTETTTAGVTATVTSN